MKVEEKQKRDPGEETKESRAAFWPSNISELITLGGIIKFVSFTDVQIHWGARGIGLGACPLGGLPISTRAGLKPSVERCPRSGWR